MGVNKNSHPPVIEPAGGYFAYWWIHYFIDVFPYNLRSEITHCVCPASVYMYLQVQMAACGSPSVADIADDLPSLHLLAGGDADAGTVCV